MLSLPFILHKIYSSTT